jgi:hypothetical protein
MTTGVNINARFEPILVLVLLVLVYVVGSTSHVLAQSKPAAKSPKAQTATSATSSATAAAGSLSNSSLPPATQDMREAIQTAAQSGRLEDLRTPIEMNELKPELGGAAGTDPIAHWKTQSADGEGRDILAALIAVLETTPSVSATGKDVENNRIFVWPSFADTELGLLSPVERGELVKLTTEEIAASMIKAGRYTGWRLAIGADGVWHSFLKTP